MNGDNSHNNFGKEIRIVGSHDVEIKNNVGTVDIYLIRDSNQGIFNINIHDNEFGSVQGYGQAYDGLV